VSVQCLRGRQWLWLSVVMLAMHLAGCASPQKWALNSLADGVARAGVGSEEDLELARDSAPVMLKASEALLARVPEHLGLAQAVAGGFTQYSFAFVASQAERLQPVDAKAAQQLNERAARLYERGHGHAMRALLHHHPQLRQALRQPASVGPAPVRFSAGEVGVAYWAAASWAAWISLSKQRPDVVADLPQALTLAQWAHAAAPAHGQGALASLLGTLEASRPGGSVQRAEAYFAEALRHAGADVPAVLVAMAESLAQPAGDRDRFTSLLQRALAADAQGRELQTQVMHQRARWLLASVDELF
jgi:TRAP transporter T-component